MGITIDKKSRVAVLTLKRLKKLTKAGMEHAAYTSGGGLMRATNQEILRKPKGGRVYVSRTRADTNRRHTASAPGETHANLTGKLRKTLGFKSSFRHITFGYGVTKNNAPDYAELVEFGTPGGQMKPRPSLQNGIKGERKNFQNNFDREIGKRLGGKVKL